MTEEEKEELHKLKSLFYTNTLTQYGKRKLIKIYEETIEKKDKIIDLMLDMLVRVHSDDKKVEFIANQNIEEKKEQERKIIERKIEKGEY